MVSIKDFVIRKNTSTENSNSFEEGDEDNSDVQLEGVGSGFVWDKYGHIVSSLISCLLCHYSIMGSSHLVIREKKIYS